MAPLAEENSVTGELSAPDGDPVAEQNRRERTPEANVNPPPDQTDTPRDGAARGEGDENYRSPTNSPSEDEDSPDGPFRPAQD